MNASTSVSKNKFVITRHTFPWNLVQSPSISYGNSWANIRSKKILLIAICHLFNFLLFALFWNSVLWNSSEFSVTSSLFEPTLFGCSSVNQHLSRKLTCKSLCFIVMICYRCCVFLFSASERWKNRISRGQLTSNSIGHRQHKDKSSDWAFLSM